MIRKKIRAATEWLEDRLRFLCGSLSPDGRIIVILSMFLILTVLSIYFSISSIYRFGKDSGEKIQIQHIEQLQLELGQKQSELDSIKQINIIDYERE
ncbi:TraL conjugative transposon family protein [Bacteroides sp. 224]|uniref:TraL conjugative transposon family protein n=1 Tax=Bacteroides sp. 224 TaxID=2302936 RepID=UPI0013D7F753|nr:TraL conjugative transposon family protein [Bacteroides sp. 224]NDV64683.1 DUF3989 domain-containing protein [Bacteroides sp. 224]